MAAHDVRLYPVFLEQRIGDDAHREDSRLRIRRQLELLLRSLKAHILDGIAQSLVRLLEQALRRSRMLVEVLAHAHGLSTLSREYEGQFIHVYYLPQLGIYLY